MKALGKILILLLFTSNILATCNWKDIEKIENGYKYPKDCHIKVGKLIKESELRKEQVEELNKTITLKDLALNKADERIINWRDTTFKLEDRIIKQRKWSSLNNYLWFGGGIAVVVLSGWALGQVSK